MNMLIVSLFQFFAVPKLNDKMFESSPLSVAFKVLNSFSFGQEV